MVIRRVIIIAVVSSSLFPFWGCSQPTNVNKGKGAEIFLSFFDGDKAEQAESLAHIEEQWQDGFIPAIIETVYLSRDPDLYFRLITLLQEKTGKNFGYEFNDWYQWLWQQNEFKTPGYAAFKAGLYKRIDLRFETYFSQREEQIKIRLDEVRWGGVRQDGIPPLRYPNMIAADEAEYLDDDNVIFGIEVNGDARAYPKRILAWHEMFVDEVGGESVAGVYCTLCGTMILYNTKHDGIDHQLGTSGFLYRSNKLMYDKATQSLWNTLQGEPVIGPLVDKGISLEVMSVVTTTWGEWKERHPNTQVLSLITGHQRDYGEGVAYHDYFSTDELMFNTPFSDRRLKNKEEVLALRLPESPNEQLAISAKFLLENPIYHDSIGENRFVVVTDASGGNRVYESPGITFKDYDGKYHVTDNSGNQWKLTESHLLAPDGPRLERLPYHRAFWFGWKAAFPDTRLVK